MATRAILSQAVANPRVALQLLAAHPRVQLLRDVLALAALVRLGMHARRVIVEYGLVGFVLELLGRLRRLFFALVKEIPFVKEKVDKELSKGLRELEESVLKDQSLSEGEHPRHFLSLPHRALTNEEIFAQLEEYSRYTHRHWNKGTVSGAVYHGGKELTELTNKAMEMFSWSNPLHPDVFPGIRKIEAEIVACVLDMYNGARIGAVGMTTSGGTESIIMCVRAHVEWGKAMKGITRPHMVLPTSAHPAFDKAAQSFGVRITRLPLHHRTFKADVRKLSNAITPSTVLVVGSAPGYPHGIIDDIAAMAAVAEAAGVGFHVDCCLGGFVVPFMAEAGYPIDPVDFRVSGVTSISCDTHKYGFAPKGSSIAMFRTAELRRFAYFTTTEWPGGIYATPTIMGSRSGANLAGCWAALMSTGRKGYIQSVRTLVEKQRTLSRAVSQVNGLQVIGEPQASVFAFTSDIVDVYRVSAEMSARGWALSPCQFPPAIHLTVVMPTDTEKFIKDITDSMTEIMKDPKQKATGSAAIYGMAATIADRSLVDRFARGYCDAMYITHVKRKDERHERNDKK